MKKRILFATNYNANDTTSYLRAWGPFTLMRDEVEIVEPLIEANSGQWWKNWRNWFNNIDVCFMHRPYGPIAAQIMAECKLAGVPLWVDHDDDLLNIPQTNEYYKVHTDGEKKFPSVEYSYRNADILTCSGKVMYDELVKTYKRSDTILITSGVDDRLLRFKKSFSGNRRVAWRGSTTHRSDLEYFRKSISNVMENAKGYEWHFWGLNPEFLNPPEKADIFYQKQLNFLQYIKSLTDYNCSIHMVPLEDNRFNRVKSNLSWLDATLAGSVVLGPNFPEFQRPGIMHYEGEDDFEDVLNFMIEMPKDLLKEKYLQSWEYIEDNLLQSHLNRKRREILRNL